MDEHVGRRLRVGEIVRGKLPKNAVEAPGQNGTFWGTPDVAVLLQSTPDGLALGTYTPRLTHAHAPGTLLPADEPPEQIASSILEILVAPWAAVRAVQPIPSPATTTCGAQGRPGIDIFILATQKRLEALHYWMRDNVGPLVVIKDDAETAMLQRYMLLLSMLVDSAQSSLACTVVHGLDRSVVIFQRVLVEYAVRAHYAIRHPDYTLWRTTVREAEEYLYWLSVEDSDEADLAAAREQLADVERAHPAIAKRGRSENWKDIHFKEMFLEVASREQHASLYHHPSTFIHGDPASMRHIFRTNDAGVLEGVTRLSDAELNSDLVDVSAMLIEFLGAYQLAFSALAENEEARSRLGEVDRENLVHTLRYPDQREEAYLAHARQAVGQR